MAGPLDRHASSADRLSTNGTFCNGERVRGPLRLRDGTNQQIGTEVHLGVDAVKVHLRALYRRLGIAQLPQNEKRARLAQLAIHRGLVRDRDLEA